MVPTRCFSLRSAAFLFVSIGLASLVPAGPLQDVRDAIRRAKDFGNEARSLVTSADLEPVWPKDGGPILLVKTERDGSRRVSKLNPDNGGLADAFDHAALTTELARRTGDEPRGLRFDFFKIDPEQPRILRFSTNGRGWAFDMADGTLEEREFQPQAATLAPPSALLRGGRRVGKPVKLIIENATDGDIKVGWVAGWREIRPHSRIPAGGRSVIETYEGEKWIASDRSGRNLAGLRAEAVPTLARITGPVAERQRPRRENRGGGDVSPDGKWRAVVRSHNLFLEPTGGDPAVALTENGSGTRFYEGPFEWSPDSKHLVCRLTRRVDQREVHIVESSPDDQVQPKLIRFPYTKPGDPIRQPMPRLFDVAQSREIPVDDKLFANPWSIDHAAWAADSSEFSFLYNQRGHQVLRIVGIRSSDGAVRTIHEEISETFIDYSQKTYLRRLPETREILWASERSGWNHLYLIDEVAGKVKHAVTSGEWVVREVVDVDEEKRSLLLRVFGFHQGQDPYHSHFIRVDMDGGAPQALTEADGDHRIRFSPDKRWIVDTWSRVDQPPVTEVRRADGSLVAEVARADDAELRKTGWSRPERFVAKGRDGKTEIHGILVKPRDFDPAKRYPVVESIYAGPHDFFTPKSYSAWFSMNDMAELGFVVVKLDGMGTNWRSKAFHDVCWKNLMDGGFPDRIAWLKEAAKTHPWMDLGRMGIFGGSAGGQNALAGLLNHGDFYKAGVADCGCHDNRMDKIWWNEAWMGWPVDESYARNSNVTHAAKLEAPLLLVVGELDHNVDPASTAQVAAALQKAGRMYEYLPVMNAGHGAAETEYGNLRRAEFLMRQLGGPE
ncbi:MAG: prolyl oligopeptidase family serine peptidase [Verrucomicrobiae bacterium]|nr:prolyl oligopeptidase family serine peptidase [Verrucomicrobiae bacterium]